MGGGGLVKTCQIGDFFIYYSLFSVIKLGMATWLQRSNLGSCTSGTLEQIYVINPHTVSIILQAQHLATQASAAMKSSTDFKVSQLQVFRCLEGGGLAVGNLKKILAICPTGFLM